MVKCPEFFFLHCKSLHSKECTYKSPLSLTKIFSHIFRLLKCTKLIWGRSWRAKNEKKFRRSWHDTEKAAQVATIFTLYCQVKTFWAECHFFLLLQSDNFSLRLLHAKWLMFQFLGGKKNYIDWGIINVAFMNERFAA